MALIRPANIGALVIDANVAVAIAARELGRDVKATAELIRYASMNYAWFAPGAIVTEALYALCQKYQAGTITAIEHDNAVTEFEILMRSILPPPSGEVSIVQRAHAIASGYGCSRSADAAYIALAEELSKTKPTVLITFDQDLPKQARQNAPTVNVQLM
jgi:predicted nucleic acid-binding protein